MNKSDNYRGFSVLTKKQEQDIVATHKPYDRQCGTAALAKKYHVHRRTIERVLGKYR